MHLQRPTNTSMNNTLTSLVTASGDDLVTGLGKSYGILFDVETTPTSSSLVIAGMDLYLVDTTLSTHYEIWTKTGSWEDIAVLTTKPADYLTGFHKVSHGTITSKRAASDFSKISLQEFQDVEILGGGTRQAFYITLSDNLLLFKSYETPHGLVSSRHEMASIVQASNTALQVYYGAAVRAYPLELADPTTDFWDNAGFVGRIWTKQYSHD